MSRPLLKLSAPGSQSSTLSAVTYAVSLAYVLSAGAPGVRFLWNLRTHHIHSWPDTLCLALIADV